MSHENRLGGGSGLIQSEASFTPCKLRVGWAILIEYRPNGGEVEMRHVIPRDMVFMLMPGRVEPCWCVEVFDMDRNAPRTFAFDEIRPVSGRLP